MHNIIKYFYKNGSYVFKIIGIVLTVLLIIQLSDKMYENKQMQLVQNTNNIDSGKSAIDNYSNYVVTQNDNVSKKDSEIINETMKVFVDYCNKGDINNAYKMLTDSCKEKLYYNIDIFNSKYIKKIFTEYRNYTMQAWAQQGENYTFLIELVGDILANGGKDGTIQEYYTFIKQKDATYKINISNYIHSQEYEHEILEQDGIKYEIITNDVYKDYTEYEFRIYNDTENDILLNGNKYIKKIYLLDSNNVSYSSINSQFEENDEIVIKSKNTQKFKVRFNKSYNPSAKLKYIVFNDIVFNYEEYSNMNEGQENYGDRKTIKFKLK